MENAKGRGDKSQKTQNIMGAFKGAGVCAISTFCKTIFWPALLLESVRELNFLFKYLTKLTTKGYKKE